MDYNVWRRIFIVSAREHVQLQEIELRMDPVSLQNHGISFMLRDCLTRNYIWMEKIQTNSNTMLLIIQTIIITWKASKESIDGNQCI